MTTRCVQVRFSGESWSQDEFAKTRNCLRKYIECHTAIEDDCDRQASEIVFLISRLSPLFDRFFLNQTLVLLIVSSSTTISASLYLVMPGGVKIASEVETGPLQCHTLLDDLVSKWAHVNDTTIEHCFQMIKYVFNCGFLASISEAQGLDVIPDKFVLGEDDTTFFVEAPTINSDWVNLLSWLSPLESVNRRIISFTQFSIETSNRKAGKVWRRHYRTNVAPFECTGDDVNVIVEREWATVYADGTFTRSRLLHPQSPERLAYEIAQHINES